MGERTQCLGKSTKKDDVMTDKNGRHVEYCRQASRLATVSLEQVLYSKATLEVYSTLLHSPIWALRAVSLKLSSPLPRSKEHMASMRVFCMSGKRDCERHLCCLTRS